MIRLALALMAVATIAAEDGDATRAPATQAPSTPGTPSSVGTPSSAGTPAPVPSATPGPGSSSARWHYLPSAGYDDEPLHLELAEARDWRVIDDHDQAIAASSAQGGALRAVVDPAGCARVRALAPDHRELGLCLVRPGAAAGLNWIVDTLRMGDDSAVLILSHIDAHADRRWSLLRSFGGTDHSPCARRLEGEGVLALAAASQALAVSGQGVLVVLPPDDRLIGWKHREYRQVVAWIVADACARGAAAVVLVEPHAPDADVDLIRPLVRAARDVAAAYQCQIAHATALSDHAYWEVAPGVLGRHLNDAGRRKLDEIVAPWVAR